MPNLLFATQLHINIYLLLQVELDAEMGFY